MPPTVVAARPHIAALSALLTGAGLTVLPGGQGEPAAPCVVLWPSPGTPEAGSLGDPTSDLIVEVTTVACGTTTDQALWVADKVTAALSRVVPTITGRTAHPITFVDATDVRRDDSLATPLQSTAIRWRLLTTPA
jgi:hypothetical protein